MLAFDLQRFAGEKTEKATPKRRKKSIEDGQIPKSRDLVSSVSFLIALFVIRMLAQNIWGVLYKDWTYNFSHVGQFHMTPENLMTMLEQQLLVLIRVVYPIILIPMAIGLVASYAQVKVVFLPKLLIPKFSRLNPASGIKRLFGLDGFVATLQSFSKLLVVGGLVYLSVQALVPQITSLSQLPDSMYPSAIAGMMYGVLLKAAIGLVVISIFDYAYQRYRNEQKLKMTKDEVKREHKDIEGNPEIKKEIRQRGLQIASKRMMQKVPQADVVVTNPTHFAVCLQYERGKRAPIVIAKGADEVAFRIRAVASQHSIPIVENKPLARELYKVCEIDDPVPVHLFKAVAELLAYVYRRKGRMVRA